jgi:XTP/dITP diphosphohydrolase
MKKMETIYFVTSNIKKFTSLNNKLSSLNLRLERLEYDFDEGRELSIKQVAKNKLAQAKKAFPGKRLIVDDRGFFIPALNGFPGPFVKLLLESFSYNGLIKLMKDENDRRAVFSYAVAYYDGKKDTVLVADETGFITNSPKGNNLHGWTELLYIYGYPSFPDRSLAELSDSEWEKYLEDIEDIDPFALLDKYLSRHI